MAGEGSERRGPPGSSPPRASQVRRGRGEGPPGRQAGWREVGARPGPWPAAGAARRGAAGGSGGGRRGPGHAGGRRAAEGRGGGPRASPRGPAAGSGRSAWRRDAPGSGRRRGGRGGSRGGPRPSRRDARDKEGERRGPRGGREADESQSVVQRARAGPRVWARGTRGVARRLRLAVNAATRAVARPWPRPVRGVTFTGPRPPRRRGRAKAREACQPAGGPRPSRPRGGSRGRVAGEGRRSRDGGDAAWGLTAAPSRVKARDAWGRRRWRGSLGPPGGRRHDREGRRRGVSRALAWHPGQAAPGRWRRRPALALALPGRSGDRLGVPRRQRSSRRGVHPPTRRRRDPSVRWGGRGEVARPPPIPISSGSRPTNGVSPRSAPTSSRVRSRRARTTSYALTGSAFPLIARSPKDWVTK